MQSNKESNQKLIERFPFLIPRNRWTGKIPEDYDYSYTELDSMPDGWRKAFGEQMCEDIREELVRAEYLDQYRITQIKEKYGTLCWYDFGCTERMLRDIIPKYERLWEADCTMKYCLKDPEALYDYITGTLKPVPVFSGESTSQQE